MRLPEFWGEHKLTSLPGTNGNPAAEGKFTLGKTYQVLNGELWTLKYAEFQVKDDDGVERWLCCGCFNEAKYSPKSPTKNA